MLSDGHVQPDYAADAGYAAVVDSQQPRPLPAMDFFVLSDVHVSEHFSFPGVLPNTYAIPPVVFVLPFSFFLSLTFVNVD